MSMTSIVREPEIKDLFSSVLVRPSPIPDRAMVAPPLTENYRLVGTAFDYLMRFYLQRLNPHSLTQKWIAEKGVDELFTSSLTWDMDEDKLEDDPRVAIAEKYQSDARQHYRQYIVSGVITDKLLVSALRLAYLDGLYRAGPDYFDEASLKKVNKKDVQDLRNLTSAIDPEQFVARKACFLNPTFGQASRLVGGADADVVIDDKIIEIKTTKSLGLDKLDLYQLVGYYLLVLLDGITSGEGDRKTHVLYAEKVSDIAHVGIYFSRHAYLCSPSAHSGHNGVIS